MNTHNCNTCTKADGCKKPNVKDAETSIKLEGANNQAYSYYSRVLKQPFDSVADLREAEDAYYAELRAKEAKANIKDSDAKKVEEAFKALNAARKTYKESLEQLTDEYNEAMADLKKAFEAGRTDMQSKLAAAEDNYSKILREFTEKHPEFTLTLEDDNIKTTISNHTKVAGDKKPDMGLMNLFDLLFNF